MVGWMERWDWDGDLHSNTASASAFQLVLKAQFEEQIKWQQTNIFKTQIPVYEFNK